MKNDFPYLGIILGLAFIVLVGWWLHRQSADACNALVESGLGGGQGRPTKDSPSPIGTYRVTAYCSCARCCGKWSDGFTACGHKIREGDRFIAAPPEFAFGTVLDIPGYGTCEVLDRGGAIKGRRFDVYFSTHQAALNWGVQFLEVFEL